MTATTTCTADSWGVQWENGRKPFDSVTERPRAGTYRGQVDKHGTHLRGAVVVTVTVDA